MSTYLPFISKLIFAKINFAKVIFENNQVFITFTASALNLPLNNEFNKMSVILRSAALFRTFPPLCRTFPPLCRTFPPFCRTFPPFSTLENPENTGLFFPLSS